jgi:hypothetical protein
MEAEEPYLLKYKAIPRTPSKDSIVALEPVDSGLTSDRPPALRIDFQELFTNSGSLGVEAFFAPRYCVKLTSDMFAEYRCYVGHGCRERP